MSTPAPMPNTQGPSYPENGSIHLRHLSAAAAAGSGIPADGSVTAAKLASNAVTTVKILDANVTEAKLSSAVQAKLIVKAAAEADLAGGADLPTTVTKVNNILAKLRSSGVIS